MTLRRAPTTLAIVLAALTGAGAAAAQGPAGQGSRAEARRPLHDLGGTAADFARDFWMTFSAPARMDRSGWLTTAGVLAIGGLLYTVDQELTDAAIRNRNATLFEPIVDTGTFLEPIGLMGNTNIWYAAGALTAYAVGWERPRRALTELLYAHWIAGAIRGATNRVVGRSRPHDGEGARTFALGGGTSFPSGHASSIFQVAAVLSHHVNSPPASIAFYGLATTVAIQRITSEQHWASDVWLGAAYGWAVAKLVIRLHEEEALRLVPVAPPTGGVGVALRFSF